MLPAAIGEGLKSRACSQRRIGGLSGSRPIGFQVVDVGIALGVAREQPLRSDEIQIGTQAARIRATRSSSHLQQHHPAIKHISSRIVLRKKTLEQPVKKRSPQPADEGVIDFGQSAYSRKNITNRI